jgi:hypothetical protein
MKRRGLEKNWQALIIVIGAIAVVSLLISVGSSDLRLAFAPGGDPVPIDPPVDPDYITPPDEPIECRQCDAKFKCIDPDTGETLGYYTYLPHCTSFECEQLRAGAEDACEQLHPGSELAFFFCDCYGADSGPIIPPDVDPEITNVRENPYGEEILP